MSTSEMNDVASLLTLIHSVQEGMKQTAENLGVMSGELVSFSAKLAELRDELFYAQSDEEAKRILDESDLANEYDRLRVRLGRLEGGLSTLTKGVHGVRSHRAQYLF